VLERGRDLAAATAGGDALARELDEHLRRGRRRQVAQQLHTVVSHLGFLLSADGFPPRQAQELEKRCRSLWEQRDQILDAGKGSALSAAEEGQLRTDLLDLATFWAGLRVRLASDDRAALRVLDEAERLLGPSPVLEDERRILAQKRLGLAEKAVKTKPKRQGSERKPRTSWERYALGRALLSEGKLDEAAEAFERVLEVEPENFWANFSSGVCAYRRKQFAAAVHAFGVCVALAPKTAECYYHRGLAHDAARQPAQALRDYDRALQLDPNLAAAAHNRGLLHYQAGRYVEAETDLEQALARGLENGTVYHQLALTQEARGKRAAALASVRRALQKNPHSREASDLLKRLLRPAP
jgi:tetratricopeptide (TPR) repeat protein